MDFEYFLLFSCKVFDKRGYICREYSLTGSTKCHGYGRQGHGGKHAKPAGGGVRDSIKTMRGDVNTDEQELLRLIKRGDTNAMRVLYLRHIGYLKGVCSRYITTDDDIKDILHDSFVKIITSVGCFKPRGEGSLRSWMARIVANESINFLRRNKRFSIVVDEENAMAMEDEEQPDTDDIPPERLHEMIRQLPEGYRTVLNLYALEGHSHREIATMLGIKESSSASQLHRARGILARKIKEYKSKKTSGL